MKAKKLLEKVGAVAASEKLNQSQVAEINFLFGELNAEEQKEVQPVCGGQRHQRHRRKGC